MKNTDSIGEILNKELYIPVYQRNYEWEQVEINDFFDDLYRLYNNHNKDKVHFFGQLVVHYDKDKKQYNIIDGQQRVITTSIFINNIRIKAKKMYDELEKNDSNKKIKDELDHIKAEAAKYIGDECGGFHIHSSNSFIDKALNKKIEEDEYKNNKINKRIKVCDDLAEKKIEEILEEDEGIALKVRALHKLLDTLTEKFKVIYLETEDLEDAFIIFETLNARGKNLETADLLKNYLFGKSGNKVEESNKKWNTIISNLDQIDITTFIRHYWNSKEIFARKKELYGSIIKGIVTYEDVKNFLESLEKSSIVYASLDNPYNDNTCFKDKKLKESLQNLNSLKAITFYPIILALKSRKYEEKYIFDVVSALENYIFRNYTISKRNPNGAEIIFADIAKKITDEKLNNVEDIINEITKDKVSDEEFKMSFSQISIKSKDAIRYIFRKIHSYYKLNDINKENETNNKKVTKPELDILKETEDIHIEHIMPIDMKKWIEAGINIDSQTHDEYLWRIGNLTLLGQEYNQAISNNPFYDKKETYKKSEILPNNQIAQKEKWDTKEIEERQEELSEIAQKIWTINGLQGKI